MYIKQKNTSGFVINFLRTLFLLFLKAYVNPEVEEEPYKRYYKIIFRPTILAVKVLHKKIIRRYKTSHIYEKTLTLLILIDQSDIRFKL